MPNQPRFGSGGVSGRRMQVEDETREIFGKAAAKEDRRLRNAAIGAGAGTVAANSPLTATVGAGTWKTLRGHGVSRGTSAVGAGYMAGQTFNPRILAKMPGKYKAILGGGAAAGAGIGALSGRPRAAVAKRDYDPESRRQRRLGALMAGLGGAGVAGTFLGGRGVIQATRAARKAGGVVGNKDKSALELVREAHKNGVVASGKDLGRLGIGVAGLSGAGVARHHAESPRGRRYT